MALKPCKECTTSISTRAKWCPYCGKADPHVGKLARFIASTLAYLIVIPLTRAAKWFLSRILFALISWAFSERVTGRSKEILAMTRKAIAVSGTGGERNDAAMKYHVETGEGLRSNAASISSMMFCAASLLLGALRMGLPTTRKSDPNSIALLGVVNLSCSSELVPDGRMPGLTTIASLNLFLQSLMASPETISPSHPSAMSASPRFSIYWVALAAPNS